MPKGVARALSLVTMSGIHHFCYYSTSMWLFIRFQPHCSTKFFSIGAIGSNWKYAFRALATFSGTFFGCLLIWSSRMTYPQWSWLLFLHISLTCGIWHATDSWLWLSLTKATGHGATVSLWVIDALSGAVNFAGRFEAAKLIIYVCFKLKRQHVLNGGLVPPSANKVHRLFFFFLFCGC